MRSPAHRRQPQTRARSPFEAPSSLSRLSRRALLSLLIPQQPSRLPPPHLLSPRTPPRGLRLAPAVPPHRHAPWRTPPRSLRPSQARRSSPRPPSMLASATRLAARARTPASTARASSLMSTRSSVSHCRTQRRVSGPPARRSRGLRNRCRAPRLCPRALHRAAAAWWADLPREMPRRAP